MDLVKDVTSYKRTLVLFCYLKTLLGLPSTQQGNLGLLVQVKQVGYKRLLLLLHMKLKLIKSSIEQ